MNEQKEKKKKERTADPRKIIRVLLTKSRMDAHDRGVRNLALELSHAGVEVILTRYRLPSEIVSTAIQEAVDVIGVSCSTGGHLYIAETIRNGLKEKRIRDIKVIFGGIIPESDLPSMKKLGVSAVFGPGCSMTDIMRAIE